MMQQNFKNTQLRSYYDSLPKSSSPKTDFLLQVASECNVSVNCVRNWITGCAKPKKAEHIQVLSKITGLNPQNLF